MTALQERIKRHEGLRLKPYKDSLGYWTIGYGHLMTAKEKIAFADGITKEQAEELFQKDFDKHAAQAKSISGSRWNIMGEARQGVLIEMVFQLGMSSVLKFKRMWAAIDAADYVAAAAAMRDSLWNKQTPARCDLLAKIMETGKETA